MGTYEQKPNAPQLAPAARMVLPDRTRFRQQTGTVQTLGKQRTARNHTEQRCLKTGPESFGDTPVTGIPRTGSNFSRIPVRSNGVVVAGLYNKRNDHVASELHRHATGPGPSTAPDIVHEVLEGQGQPIPNKLRRDMEGLLGEDFADVRFHTGERASASAQAVAADAYTVGRHVVFASGQFNPGSVKGRQLLAHELSHAAGYRPGVMAPSGDLHISAPTEAAERQAVAISAGAVSRDAMPVTQPRLFRQVAPIAPLAGVSVNHARVTVPPAAGLTFSATITPANASGVTLSIAGINATIDAGTTVNSTSGAITVAAGQTGGSANVEARQNATGPGGATLVSTAPATAPFNFNAIPSGITSTSASTTAGTGVYGGDFTHTFSSPAGGQSALERSHVNELFAAATGTRLVITGALNTTLTVTVNNAGSATAGWDLDDTGMMTSPDHVTWSNTVDARPYVVNASHPTPNPGLPQVLTAAQDFRNLTFPGQTYGAAIASTTHRRAIEDRNNQLKAVTSANASGINEEIVEDYVGPTVFRRCLATPDTIRVAAPTPPGGEAPEMDTSTITVDTEGQAAVPTFSIRSPDLGCTITTAGELTPGTTAGTVTVRAGDAVNFDETTVTLTPRPATFIRLEGDSTPAQIVQDNNLSQRGMVVEVLRRLNPELQSSATIATGTVIWLIAREVPAMATGFEPIAERYFGSTHRWPKLWSFNPEIRDPSTIEPTTRIHLQSAADRTQFGEIPLDQ